MLEVSPKARTTPIFAGALCIAVAALLTACRSNASPQVNTPAYGKRLTVAGDSPSPSPIRVDLEVALRNSISDEVADAWKRDDFAWLDATADEYVRNRVKTYSGKWRLSIFYSALSSEMQIAWSDDWYLPQTGPCRCSAPDPAHYKDAGPRWDNIRAKVDRWVKQFPQSPHAQIALAHLLVNRAWFYRGAGYANSIPPAAWPLVSRYLEESTTVLMRNRNVRAADPEWFDLMFFVASAQSWPQGRVDKLLQDLRESGQSYAPAYQSAASQMLPKWGGSYEQVEGFAQQAISDNGDDGVDIYARIYWSLGADVFAQTRADWPTMKRGFDSMTRKYPDFRNLNGMAMFACAAGDETIFRDSVGRLGANLTPDTWPISVDYCKTRYGTDRQ